MAWRSSYRAMQKNLHSICQTKSAKFVFNWMLTFLGDAQCSLGLLYEKAALVAGWFWGPFKVLILTLKPFITWGQVIWEIASTWLHLLNPPQEVCRSSHLWKSFICGLFLPCHLLCRATSAEVRSTPSLTSFPKSLKTWLCQQIFFQIYANMKS